MLKNTERKSEVKPDLFLNEIKSCFLDLSADEKQDFSKISATLNDVNIVKKYLLSLEEKLQQDYELKKISRNPNLIFKLFADSIGSRFKLLSDVLYHWAIENKLVDYHPKNGAKFIKINRLLDGGSFLNLLRNGMFFKDVGVPEEHGPWTHFIQWYIIFEHFNALNNQNGLKKPPLELYQLLGDQKCIGKVRDDNMQSEVPMWFLICDRSANHREPNDFRAPDNLHKFILQNFESYPLLSLILKKTYKNKSFFDESLANTEEKFYKNDNVIKTPARAT